GDLHLATEARTPRPLVAREKHGGGVPGAGCLGSDGASHLPAIDGEADALAHQRRAVPGGVAGGEQPIARAAWYDSLRWEETRMILQRAGATEGGREAGEPLGEGIEILARVGRHIRANHADPQAHATVAAREGPGVARWRDLAAHDEVEALL